MEENEGKSEIIDALNTDKIDIPKSESGIDTLKHLKSNTITVPDSNGDYTIKYNIKPKVKVGKLLKGDIAGAVENTKLMLEFGKEFKDSDAEITIKFNGNIAAVLNSPRGDVSASICATKRF